MTKLLVSLRVRWGESWILISCPNGQDVQPARENLLCPARRSFIGQTCLVKMDTYRVRETSALSRENKISCFPRDLGFKCCCSKYLKVVIDDIFPSSSKYGKPAGWLWSKNWPGDLSQFGEIFLMNNIKFVSWYILKLFLVSLWIKYQV